MDNKKKVIELRGVTKSYQMGDTEVRALDGVDLEIEQGDYVAIMGPSGSGKSSMMHVLGLLDSPSSGSYRLLGREVSQLSGDELAALRNETLGFVFQQFNLLPRTPATENVSLPVVYRTKKGNYPTPEELLQKVGLGHRLHHLPNELSGGQQQRVAIARSLINAPSILFADEPTGNLDSVASKEIIALFKQLNESGITIVLVTHEAGIAKNARRIIRMLDGKIESDERTDDRSLERASTVETVSSESKAKFAWLQVLRVHLRQAFRAILSNRLRSGLSMLGISIGVCAVIAMLAIGQGAKETIEKDLASLGSNLLVLMPGSFRPMGVATDASAVIKLTMDDAREIAHSVGSVKQTSSSVSGKVMAVYGRNNWSTTVTGAAPQYASLHASPARFGRYFTQKESDKRERVAVIGPTVARELFGDANPIGASIKLNRISFQVIGVLKAKGAQGFRDQDDTIVVPLNTAMKRLLGKEYVDQVDIEVSDPKQMERVEHAVSELIIKRHRLAPSQEDSFSVRNMSEIQNTLAGTSRVLSLLLALIASISLLVGGIGIMNIMLVSVTERTKEIGLRKAIGAKHKDILVQFLIESAFVSGLGGLVGVLGGWAIAAVVTVFTGWSATVSASSVFGALIFSAFIGIVFGLWPARKAAALSPIKALRYE